MRDDLTASVQYGDYNGTVAADDHDRRGLKHLAEKYGIDTARFFIIGVSVHLGEHRDETTKVAEPFVELIAIDSQLVQAYGAGAVQSYVDDHNGLLPCVRIRIHASLDEVLLSLKRFEMVLKNSHIKRATFQPAEHVSEVEA
jgi:hypothetical protein